MVFQAKPGKQSEKLKNMDKDKNGVLSYLEFSSRSNKMFSFLDQNSDGSVTRNEFNMEERLRKEKRLLKLADKLDRNDDKKIDKNEFIIGSKERSKPRKKEKRKGLPEGKKEVSEAIFKALDTDKDGSLNAQELSRRNEVGPKVAKDIKFKKLDLNNNKELSKEEFMSEVEKKFNDMDKNSDQVIDKKELKGSFKKKKNNKKKYKDNMWKGKPPTMHGRPKIN
tara:strand:+ start:983 stop:1651 length:669 start_codon:yes stop_codon:yes gene_type:complete